MSDEAKRQPEPAEAVPVAAERPSEVPPPLPMYQEAADRAKKAHAAAERRVKQLAESVAGFR